VIAERDGISQNELLEQAAEHEVIARGALLADDLETAAAQLRMITASAYSALVDASVAGFAEGEGNVEPLRPRRISRPRPSDTIGAIAAFEHRD